MRAALFALAGLILGSFLTVVVHRVPRRESVVRPRSRCPRCGTELRARDNVPVLSYVMLRGRCRTCGERVSPEYPLSELATAGLFAGASLAFREAWLAGLMAVFLALMMAVGLIDARWRIVPNRIVYPALLAYGVALAAGHLVTGRVNVLDGLIGLGAYGVPLFLVALIAPGGMGMGDVKLAALIGLVLGSLGLSYVAVAAALGILGGGLYAVAALLFLGYRRREHIPFGPFLAGGAVASAFFAPPLARAYLSLLGVQ